MKNKKSLLLHGLAVLLAASHESHAVNITGDTVTTDLTVNGQDVYLGSTSTSDQFRLLWRPQTTITQGILYFDSERQQGAFDWRDDVAVAAKLKMRLEYSNVLKLYKADGTTVGLELIPESNKIDLKGAVGAGIYSGSTPIITLANATSANITVSNLTVTGDSFINGVRIGQGLGGIDTNTTMGLNALDSNTSGGNNAASGASALTANTTGGRNTAQGSGALINNTLGSGNSAIGAGALYYNVGLASPSTAGSNNTALGDSAGVWFGATGTGQLNAASYGVYIGAGSRGAAANEVNSIVIGATAVGKGSNKTVIGTPATTETHLAGTTITNALNVSGTTVLTGATTLNGSVTLAAPQGDISMGIYSN